MFYIFVSAVTGVRLCIFYINEATERTITPKVFELFKVFFGINKASE